MTITEAELKTLVNAKDLGFSIITNFGCDNNCWYCVWKNFHKLSGTPTSANTTDWVKLEALLKAYPKGKINISGGLDPLYNYQKNKKWWDTLFRLAKRNGKQVDIHTRVMLFDTALLSNVNKLVISFDDLYEVRKEAVKYRKYGTRIRLTKVITSSASAEELREIIDFCKRNGFQVTFKQMYGFGDGGNFEKLRTELRTAYDFGECGVMFLEHGDYNVYFMPDNKLYDRFLITD